MTRPISREQLEAFRQASKRKPVAKRQRTPMPPYKVPVPDPRTEQEITEYLWHLVHSALIQQSIQDPEVLDVMAHTRGFQGVCFYEDTLEPINMKVQLAGKRDGKNITARLQVFPEAYMQANCAQGHRMILPVHQRCPSCDSQAILQHEGMTFMGGGSYLKCQGNSSLFIQVEEIKSLTQPVKVTLNQDRKQEQGFVL